MKKLLAGLAAGLALGSASVAGAATIWQHSAGGITCRATSGTGIACVRSSGGGYGVGISTYGVLVMDVDSGRTVFKRFQP